MASRINRNRNMVTVPVFQQSLVLQLVNQVLTFLGLIGVIVDPTTAGIGDSDRAMQYIEPWDDDREN